VLKGARQVGKTYSLLEFGKTQYEDKKHRYHHIDLKKQKHLYSIFEENLDPDKIIKQLRLSLKREIDIKHDLIILDEIQECPHAITSLKYFQQDMKTLDIVAAGSHLGLIKNEVSFPVGKVNFLHMFPMHFNEYLKVMNTELYSELSEYNMMQPLPAIIHKLLLEHFTSYLFTGGLPEVVAEYINSNQSIAATRQKQKELINGYRADFSKYAGRVNATHIQYVFDSIASQLSQSHDEGCKKYRFKDVIPNRKGFDAIRGPLGWLSESRLCIACRIAKKAEHPLLGYTDENKFKVYLFDTGILNCLLDVPGETILGQEGGGFKGFIMENYVAQELYCRKNSELYSWQEGTSELEFLWNEQKDIIPLEVKSARRSRRAKSLDAYIQRYHPPKAWKLTAQNYGYTPGRKITTIPLYCCGKLVDIIQ
jgi:predicted AAA+ superfamily ATPase